MQILRASDYRVVPWKIGKGLSRVIASRPPGAGYEDLLWHVSLPEITADCPSHGWSCCDCRCRDPHPMGPATASRPAGSAGLEGGRLRGGEARAGGHGDAEGPE